MSKKEIISEGLLYELKSSPKDPIKSIIRFCAFHDLTHTRLLLPYMGKNKLSHWVRKTLTVWIDNLEIEYEFVGMLFPKWQINKITLVE